MNTSSDNTRFGIKEEKVTGLQVRPALERLSKADPTNVLEVVASQIELMNYYHNAVIAQAKESFRWALIASGVALAFFLASIGLVLFRQSQNAAVISLISGALVQFISAINFYLYGKTSNQLAEFQSRLDVTQRFLIANSICEGLNGDSKQQARWELVREIASISGGAVGKKTREFSKVEKGVDDA